MSCCSAPLNEALDSNDMLKNVSVEIKIKVVREVIVQVLPRFVAVLKAWLCARRRGITQASEKDGLEQWRVEDYLIYRKSLHRC